MKVLIITPFITTNSKFGNFIHTGGGVAVRYENYEKELKAVGHQVRVLCPNRRTVDTWVVGSSGPITSSCIRGYPMLALTPSNLRRLLHCYRWCDVVITPETEHMVLQSFMANVFDKRIVLNVHTNVHQMLASKSSPYLSSLASWVYYSFLSTSLCSSLSTCYTVSDTNRKTMSSNGVSVNGVYELKTRGDVEKVGEDERRVIRGNLAPGATHLPLILFAGRWLSEKRIDRLAATLPPTAALVIIGDGPLPLPTTLHSPSTNVFVHRGFLPNEKVYSIFQCVEWIANASDFETFGNTSYEGNSVGTPCILQPAGGHLSQIVNDGTNGFYVDFDRPDDVVRSHIASFVCNPPSRDVVMMNIVRKADAVTILDVIEPGRCERKSYEIPTSNPVVYVLNTLRYLLFQKVLKLSILLMGSMVNLLIVLTVSLLSGVSFIPADTYEDRVRRMKERKRRRKRDVLRRFVLNAKRKIIKIREAGEKGIKMLPGVNDQITTSDKRQE